MNASGTGTSGLGVLMAIALILVPIGGAEAAVNFASTEQFRFAGPTGPPEIDATIVADDFDRDGSPDVVAAGSEQSAFLRGDGRGGFRPGGREPLKPGAPFAEFHEVEAASLNGDSNPDLVAATGTFFEGSVSSMLGNGDGRFTSGPSAQVEGDAESLAVADLDGDGDDDVAVAVRGLGLTGVQVLRGDGTGAFAPSSTHDLEGNCCGAVTIAQLDGNGSPDIATLDPFGALHVLLADGSGGFAQQAPIAVTDARGPYLDSLDTADLNGDGATDIAISNTSDRRPAVHVLLGDGLGGFAAQPPIPVRFQESAGTGPDNLTLAEIDRTAGLDAVIGSQDLRQGAFLVLSGDGAGDFGSQVSFAAHMGPSAVTVGDFDRDGLADLAGANHYEALSITTMLGRRGRVTCDGKTADFVGQEPGETRGYKDRSRENDSAFGGPERDVISTGAGADNAFGGQGNDAICGGAAGDRLLGVKGDDVLLGGRGPDSLNGGSGEDTCVGAGGDDRLRSCERVR
jgi:hypothetical protein